MALKSKSLKKASKAAAKSSKKRNKQVERVIADAPKATKYGLKAAANTFVPFYSKTAQSFASQHRDLKNWVRNSSPFRSGQGNIPANERRITNNAKAVLAAFKTDIKKGHLLDFRNTNAVFNKAIGGVMEEGFDDNYDAEMMVNDSFGESGDSGSQSSGPMDYDAMFADMLGNDTYVETQQAATSATLDSIDNATGSITDATIGAAEYSSNKITAGINVAMSHLAEYQIQTNEILTDINNNIASIVEHNNMVADFQNQTLDFFQKTESSLNQLVELTKYSVGKADERYREDREDPYDFLADGKFDIKKFMANAWNSQAGQLAQMAIGQLNPILKLFGINIGDKVNNLYKADSFEFNPAKTLYNRSPIKRIFDLIDKNVSTSIEIIFHKLATGKFSTGIDWLDDTLASVGQTGMFGSTRYGNIRGANIKGFDTKNMAHLTEATIKTIENVIPDYLSGIEGYLRNIYEGIYDGSMASTFEFLNPEASVRNVRKKEIEDELNNLKYGDRKLSDREREKLYSPINSRLDTIIDILSNGVGVNIGASGVLNTAPRGVSSIPQKQINISQGPIDVKQKPNETRMRYNKYADSKLSYAEFSKNRFDEARRYEQQKDAEEAAKKAEEAKKKQEQERKNKFSSVLNFINDNSDLSIVSRLDRYCDTLLRYIDEFLIYDYDCTEEELDDPEIEEIRTKIRLMLGNTGDSGNPKNKLLVVDDVRDMLLKTKLVTNKVEERRKAEEARHAEIEKARRKERKAEKDKNKQMRNKYLSRGEFEGNGYKEELAAKRKQEEEWRKKEEEDRRNRIEELESQLNVINDRNKSMGLSYQDAFTSANKRQESIKNKTVGKDNRIFDIGSGKFRIASDIEKDIYKQIDNIKSSAYGDFVNEVTKLIGNKETKNNDRLKEITNFINNLPPDFIANDEIMNQLMDILIKDGDIESSLDLEGNNLTSDQVKKLLPALVLKLVNSSKDYSTQVSEFMESISDGNNALLSLARGDTSGRILTELNNYARNNTATNAKFFNWNKGVTKEERKNQVKEWKKTVNDALKNNQDSAATERARTIADELMDAYDEWRQAEEIANTTGSSEESKKASKKALNKYLKKKRLWTSNSIGKSIQLFDDGTEVDESMISLFSSVADMDIGDPLGIGFGGKKITISNPHALFDLIINRLPTMAALNSDNDLYRTYKSAYSSDLSLKGLANGVKTWFTGSGYSSSDNDDESEGSGWGDHYSQLSYGNKKYGNTTMAKGACGPVALANAFNRLGIQVDPITMAAISEAMGYAVDGGTSAGLFTNGVNALGLKGSEIGLNSVSKALRSGSQVILSGKSVGGGMYTPAGHIISLNGINGNRVGVDDPLRKTAISKSLNDVLKGAKHAWSVGSGEGDSSINSAISNAGDVAKAVVNYGKEAVANVGIQAKTAFAQAGENPVAQDIVILTSLLTTAQDISSNVKTSTEELVGPNGWFTNQDKEEKKKERDKFLFGEKDENGFYTGGILGPDVANWIKEIRKSLRYSFTGKGYNSYAHGKIEDGEGFIEQQRRAALIRKYGENYRDDPNYQALPDHMKDYEDRVFKPKLKMASSSEIGENGTAKDTYDYGKYKKLPCGGEVRGWIWEDDGWKFLVTKDGENKRITPTGDWGSMLIDKAAVPGIACTEEAMKQANSALSVSESPDGNLVRDRKIPITKVDGFLSFLGVDNPSTLGPNGEAYDSNDYKTVEAKVEGLSILGWRFNDKEGIWKFHYSFHSKEGKSKEYTFNTRLTEKNILPPHSLTEAFCKSLVEARGSSKWSNDSIEKVNEEHFEALRSEYSRTGKNTLATANIRRDTNINNYDSFSTIDAVWEKDEKAKCWKLIHKKSNGDISETLFPNYNNLSSPPDERATGQAMKFVSNIEADEDNETNKRLFGLFGGTKGTKGFKKTVDKDGKIKTNRIASSFYDAIYDATEAVEDVKKKGRAKSFMFGTLGLMLIGPSAVIPGMIAGTALGAFEKTKFGKNTSAFVFGGKDANDKKHQGLLGGALGTIKKLLLGKSTFGAIVGAIIGGMLGNGPGALAGATVLSHLFDKGSKLRKIIIGGRNANGEMQWSPLVKALKGVLKFIFAKGHVTGAVLGGMAGASMGLPGMVIGSILGGRVLQPGLRAVSNLNRGRKIRGIAQNQQSGSIDIRKARSKMKWASLFSRSGKLGNVTDEELENFLANSDSSAQQKWLNSGKTLEEYLHPERIKNGIYLGRIKDNQSSNKQASEGSGPAGLNSASLAEIDEHDKLEKESMEANVETPDEVKKIHDLLEAKFHRDEVKAIADEHKAIEAEQTKHAREGSKKDKEETIAASQTDYDAEKDEDKSEKKGFLATLISGAGSLFNGIGIKGLAIGAGALYAFSKLKDTKFGKWVGELFTKAMGGLGSLIGNAIEKIDWSGVVKSVGNTLNTVIRTIDWKAVGNTICDILKSLANGGGALVDGLTDNATDLQAYDSEGNRVSTAADNMIGASYENEYNEETGEVDTKKVIIPGNATMLGSTSSLLRKAALGSLSKGYVWNNFLNISDTRTAGMYLKQGMRAANFNGGIAYSAVVNAPKAITNSLKSAGKSAGKLLAESDKKVLKVLGKAFEIVGNLLDSMVNEFVRIFNVAKDKVSSKVKNLFATFKDKFLKNEKLKKYVLENSDEVGSKITKISAASAAKLAFIGIEIADLIYNAVSGAAWRANDLFYVEESKVNKRMRTISSIFCTILAEPSGIGAIVDFLNDLAATWASFDLKHEIAVCLYKLASNDEEDKALDAAIGESEKQLAIYNSISNDTTNRKGFLHLSDKSWEDYRNDGMNMISGWIASKFGKDWNLGWESDHQKQVDQIRQNINEFESQMISQKGGAISTEDLYTNTSVENMSADDSEGYGAPKSVGYGASNSTHYSQLDKAWRNVDFGRMTNGSTTTIGTGGCGPTALANVARNLTGNKNITPTTVASMAQDYGYTANGGSAASLFTEGANRLGLSSRRVSLKSVPASLASGHKLILSGKRKGAGSPYTDAGHIISVNGIKNGKAIVDDPLKSSTESISVNKLLSGAKKAWVVDNGNAGYGTTDPQEYLDNLQAMGYGVGEDGILVNTVDKGHLAKNVSFLPNDNGKVNSFIAQFAQGSYGGDGGAADNWSSLTMANGDTVGIGGCYPTALANVLSNMTGLDIDPRIILSLFPGFYGYGTPFSEFENVYSLMYGSGTNASLPDDAMIIDLRGRDVSQNFSLIPPSLSGYKRTKFNDYRDTIIANMVSTLKRGGAIWLNGKGGGNDYLPFSKPKVKTYAPGHATSAYGYFQKGDDDTGYTDYTYIVDPGVGLGNQTNASEMAIPIADLIQYPTDTSGATNWLGFSALATFPPATQSIESIRNIISEKYKSSSAYRGFIDLSTEGFDDAEARDFTKNPIAQAQAEQKAKDMQNRAGTTISQSDIRKMNDLGYTGPNYEDWDPSDSFTAQVSNIMLAISGIAERYMTKLFGGSYKSVFGGSTGGNDWSDYNTDNIYDPATENNLKLVYSIKTPNGEKPYVSISASEISKDSPREVYDSIVDKVLLESYPGLADWKSNSGIPFISGLGSDESKWPDPRKIDYTLPLDATQLKKYKQLLATRRVIRANIGAAIANGAGREGYFKIPLKLTSMYGSTSDKDFLVSLGGKNTIETIRASIRQSYPASSLDELKKKSGVKYYISDDDIFKGIYQSIDKDNDGKFDPGATVYDVDGNMITTYEAFGANGSSSLNYILNNIPDWAKQKSGYSSYTMPGSFYESTRMSANNVSEMIHYAKRLAGIYETGTLLDDSVENYSQAYANPVIDNNGKIALGLIGFNGDNASEVLGRISRNPELSKEDQDEAAYLAKNLGGNLNRIRDFLNKDSIKESNMIVQQRMSEEQFRGNYFKYPLQWFDQGKLNDPRSVLLLGQFGPVGPAHIKEMSEKLGSTYLGKDIANEFTDVARAQYNYWTHQKYHGCDTTSIALNAWENRTYDAPLVITSSNHHSNYKGMDVDQFPSWMEQYQQYTYNGITRTGVEDKNVVGYGDPGMSIIDENDFDPGMKAFFKTSNSSSSEGFGIGNSTTKNSMSISATRSYAPRTNTNIDNSNSTRINAPIDVNVDLGNMESCARSMVSLLERIASNTGRSTGGTTNITNNYDGHKEIGYGDITVNQSSKTQKRAAASAPSINNNHVDKFRKIHNMVAKSSR